MNANEEQHTGRPIADAPTQDPTAENCMGKKKQKRDGEVVRDEDGNALFGGYCRAWPGKGTDHVGDGRCKLHAGSSLQGEESPSFKHGLFSDYLSPEDRDAVDALEEYDDVEKLDELINWRMARLRRALRVRFDSEDEARNFFETFDKMVGQASINGQEPGLSKSQIRELAKILSTNEQAMQQEIDLVRRLIKDRNKIAEGEDVNVNTGDAWRQMMAGGDSS